MQTISMQVHGFSHVLPVRRGGEGLGVGETYKRQVLAREAGASLRVAQAWAGLEDGELFEVRHVVITADCRYERWTR